MHCIDYIDVFARLAKSSDMKSVQKPHFDSDLINKRISFYEVEHFLVVLSSTTESPPRTTPKLIELNGFVVGLDVCESGVDPVALA